MYWRNYYMPINIRRKLRYGQDLTEDEERWLEEQRQRILRPPFYPAEKWLEQPQWLRTTYNVAVTGALMAGAGYAGYSYLKPLISKILPKVPKLEPIYREVRIGKLGETQRTIIGYKPIHTATAPSLSREAKAFLNRVPGIIRTIEPSSVKLSAFHKEILANLQKLDAQMYPTIADELAARQAKEAVRVVSNLANKGYSTAFIHNAVCNQLAQITPALVNDLTAKKVSQEVIALGAPVKLIETEKEAKEEIKLLEEKPIIKYDARIKELESQIETAETGADRLSLLKQKQNLEIARDIAESSVLPPETAQMVYVYNLTGERISDPEELEKTFLSLLETNDPTAYKAYKFGNPLIDVDTAKKRVEEITTELSTLQKDIDKYIDATIPYVKKTLEDEGIKVPTKDELYAEAYSLVLAEAEQFPEINEALNRLDELENRRYKLEQFIQTSKKSIPEHISEKTAKIQSETTPSLEGVEDLEDWEKTDEAIEPLVGVPISREQMLPGVPPEEGGPPAIEPPPEFEPEPPDYRVGFRAWADSFEHWAMSYENKHSEVPVYSQVVRPIIEASKKRFRDNKYYDKYISNIFKGMSPQEIADLTAYMKSKQIGEEIPIREELKKKADEVRAMFDFGFRRFGVEPQRYIENYLPLLSEREQRRQTNIPLRWRGFPSEVIPFFERVRKSTGEIIEDFTVEDLLRLYFNAGTWAEYRNVIHSVGEIAKTFPIEPQNEIRKYEAYLTGGVGDFDKAVKKSIEDTMKWISKGNIKEGTDAMTALTNMVYLGTIAGNPGSAAKNLTQSFHNWSEMPARWMLVGNKLYFSKEGQDILRNSGIEMGFAPYLTREAERYMGRGKLARILKAQAKLRNVGMFLFQSVDHYNRGTIYLAEWARCNYYLDKLRKGEINTETFFKKIDLAGLHPTIQKMVIPLLEEKKYEALVDMVADQRQMMTQWRYQREVRPQWMRSGVGKMAGIFMTWPTYGTAFHGGRFVRAGEAWKRGQKAAAAYQLWKELKWIAMVATTCYAGKKVKARLWPWFMFLPTQTLAALKPVIDLYQSAVAKAKGYDWMAAQKWRDFQYSKKVYIPYGVEFGNLYRALQEEENYRKALRGLGIPLYPKERKSIWQRNVWQKSKERKNIWDILKQVFAP